MFSIRHILRIRHVVTLLIETQVLFLTRRLVYCDFFSSSFFFFCCCCCFVLFFAYCAVYLKGQGTGYHSGCCAQLSLQCSPSYEKRIRYHLPLFSEIRFVPSNTTGKAAVVQRATCVVASTPPATTSAPASGVGGGWSGTCLRPAPVRPVEQLAMSNEILGSSPEHPVGRRRMKRY